MRIGEAAHTANVGVETIRFYERKGLIVQPPRPNGGGFRTYPVDTVKRIRFIREAQELGFSLSEIEDLLSLKSDPGGDCSAVRERAILKRQEVDVKIKKLKNIDKTLIALIEACPGKGSLNFCSILGAMDGGERSKQNIGAEGAKKGRKTNGRQT